MPQEDALLSTLTVAECLTYSALLRLPRHIKPEQLQVRQGAALRCAALLGPVVRLAVLLFLGACVQMHSPVAPTIAYRPGTPCCAALRCECRARCGM